MESDRPNSGDLLNVFATLVVGWSIQRAISHQAELNRVPMEHVSKMCEQIGDLLRRCLDRPAASGDTDKETIQALRLLGLEVAWLRSVAIALEIDYTEAQFDSLTEDVDRFKYALTGHGRRNVTTAARISHRIRAEALLLQWHICKRLLDSPGSVVALQRDSRPSQG